MTDIFISYKREDEVRVAPIVEGLKGARLEVWWDREISGGSSWRQSISEQLEKARCVIVVWSETSVGPLGEFVQDEAGRANARGVLLAATALVFTTNLVGLQKPLCKIPGVHAMCVSLGLEGLATEEEEEEEALWSARASGDCEGLRVYLERFPNGPYAEEANRRIDAAETVEEESWTPEELPLPLVVRATLDPLASEEAARADALTRGAEDAADLCEGYNAGEFRGASPPAVQVEDWLCRTRDSGWVCGFEGKAVCKVEARRVTQRKVCK